MAATANSNGTLSTRIPNHVYHTKSLRRRASCWVSMNGCNYTNSADQLQIGICKTRTLVSVTTPEFATAQLRAALNALLADPPPPAHSGIIRFQVPIKERGDAIEWLHAQSTLPRCFFSSRSPSPDFPIINGGTNAHVNSHKPLGVAGVGSSVFFRGSDPISIRDWRSIKRFLSRDSPLIRAYGAIRFDATSHISPEWEDYGAFYFMVPQVEFNELEEGSILAMTIAWDESLDWTWHRAINELQSTLHQISPYFMKFKDTNLGTNIASLSHVPAKPSWDTSVNKALHMIRGHDSELVKVVLARCSKYLTDICIDPVSLLSCLKLEGQNAYQFCIQPPDAPAFIGNSPEQLFHRKSLSISSEALAGTRPRGLTDVQDLHIGQDLLLSSKDNIEFTIVRENIQRKLEAICDEIIMEPRKALRKLPRVQHLCAQLSGRLRSEDDEFEVLRTLHPSPAVCGLPTEDARKFIEENEMFDRGMYAGPVGWFGGAESEFAVGIRSALVGKGHSTLVYAGAGIVQGTNPSSEWDELDLKASQFKRLLQSKKPTICHEANKIWI